MRLTALALALCALCACAHAASIASTVPDKKDIQKKLKEVVKEVLSKDEVKEPSKPEYNEQPAPVKDIENNLKSVPSNIPVKVVVETVHPAVKSEADKKENNEISESQESAEIKREEPDLKNPGAPQRMQHDTQHPETFEDASRKAAALKEQWRNNPSYISLQKELQNLKSAIEAQITDLQRSVQDSWPVNLDAEKNEQSIKLRASVKDDPTTTTTTTTTAAPFWSNNPLFQGWQTVQQNWQSNFGNFNNSLNEYFANQNQNNSCGGGGGWGWGGLGGNQQSNSQGNSGTQSDEARPPGIWQQVTQNVQNFLTGGPQQPPAGAQSDSPQPAQPNRPVIQAFQSAIQQAGSLFNRPPVQPAQPTGQAEPQKVTSEGSNSVPAKPNETQKQKPEQAVTQSGPIQQLIGHSPVVQGIAGAVQRIGQAVIPNKPREDMKSAIPDEKEEQNKGGLLIVKPKPPHRPVTGDNNDVNSSGGLDVMKAPEETKEQPSAEPAKEAPEQIKEQPSATAEEKTD